MVEPPTPAHDDDHHHKYLFERYCGVDVCQDCRDHRGLARCYCGWACSGGDGRAELVEMGEVIEEE